MIDIKLRYQAVAFLPSIEATPNSINEITRLFADKGFVQTTFQEMSIIAQPSQLPLQPQQLQPQLRFSLQLPNDEWIIRFGIGRIDVIKNGTDEKGSNMGTIEDFCTDVSGYFSKILSIDENQKVNRVALTSSVFLKEMSKETLDSIYLKLFNPFKLYSENNPTEWTSRAVARVTKKINSVDETLNFITDINRINGQVNINQEFIPVDRIAVNLDINSIPDNTAYRFGKAEIMDFYKNVPAWHNEITNEILDDLK